MWRDCLDPRCPLGGGGGVRMEAGGDSLDLTPLSDSGLMCDRNPEEMSHAAKEKSLFHTLFILMPT